jgi:hypothetical protein
VLDRCKNDDKNVTHYRSCLVADSSVDSVAYIAYMQCLTFTITLAQWTVPTYPIPAPCGGMLAMSGAVCKLCHSVWSQLNESLTEMERNIF